MVRNCWACDQLSFLLVILTVCLARVSFTSMHQAASRVGRKRRGASFIINWLDYPWLSELVMCTILDALLCDGSVGRMSMLVLFLIHYA